MTPRDRNGEWVTEVGPDEDCGVDGEDVVPVEPDDGRDILGDGCLVFCGEEHDEEVGFLVVVCFYHLGLHLVLGEDGLDRPLREGVYLYQLGLRLVAKELQVGHRVDF